MTYYVNIYASAPLRWADQISAIFIQMTYKPYQFKNNSGRQKHSLNSVEYSISILSEYIQKHVVLPCDRILRNRCTMLSLT